MHETYLVWSLEHRRWWAPHMFGYVDTAKEAGRYTLTEAEEIVRTANRVCTEEIIIPASSIFG